MKNIFVSILCTLIIFLFILSSDYLANLIVFFLNYSNKTSLNIKDEYTNPDFIFVKNTSNFTPYGKQDLLNIFYTVLNNKVNNFTFYCPKEYINCIMDVQYLSKDENILTHLNNFVHPFNSFSSLKTNISDTGEINIEITPIYSEEEIVRIKAEVTKIINMNITSDVKDDYDKIKVIHDYIINNTKYDINNDKSIKSYNAYGALFNNIATCNGYTDLMAIFLSEMGYQNFKIATTTKTSGHVWNAVNINNEWLHLDLTWDDPVSNDNENYLYHKYFLINTEELKTADNNITSTEHLFDSSIYTEFKS